MRIQRYFAGVWLLALAFLLNGCGTAQTSATTVTIHHSAPPAATTAPATVTATTQTVASPTRIRIPGIGVDAPIENITVLPSGELATPTQNPWDGAGWFNAGTRPGEVGSAVIDGHVDRPGGGPAVFWNLRDLHAGDPIVIVDAQGRSIHFAVQRVVSYRPQEIPLQEIFQNKQGVYLNLITCAGVWIPAEHQTSLRLVVYAALSPQGK